MWFHFPSECRRYLRLQRCQRRDMVRSPRVVRSTMGVCIENETLKNTQELTRKLWKVMRPRAQRQGWIVYYGREPTAKYRVWIKIRSLVKKLNEKIYNPEKMQRKALKKKITAKVHNVWKMRRWLDGLWIVSQCFEGIDKWKGLLFEKVNGGKFKEKVRKNRKENTKPKRGKNGRLLNCELNMV